MRVEVEGISTAAVGAAWPLWVADPEHRREEMAVHVAASVLQDTWRDIVHTDVNKGYQPAVIATSPDDGDQGMVIALSASAPADVPAMQAALAKAAAKVAGGGFDEAALERARAILLATEDRARGKSSALAGLIGMSHGDPGRINGFLMERDVVASLSIDDVKAAAAAWLSKPPTLLLATPKPAATPQSTAAHPAPKP